MEVDKQHLEEKSVLLRQELKVWEKTFSTDNGGRKAGREDIKANPDIAAKYKEYSKLRDILSGKAKVQKPATTTTKRRAPQEFKQSPQKRSRTPEATPSKQQKHSQVEDHAEGIEFATPVVKRTIFGPTPQKDGQVMGIFDLLPGETPSRLRTVLGNANVNVARTPSKTSAGYGDDRVEERLRGSRTPLSTGKRFLLDSFVTPKKRKENDCTTPSSSMKEFATPSFLKRDLFGLSTVNEESQSPEMARPWKRRTFGRSLSNMVRDMREKEKEKEDEEWELMREMEETDYREVVGKGKKPAPPPKALVEDSQVQLDVDGFVPSDFESDVDVKAAEIKPRKAYKKKGLKRQTRRVNMRPVMTKPQQAKTPEPDSESDDDGEVAPTQSEDPNEAHDEEEVVQETQFAAQLPDSGYLSGEEDFMIKHDDKAYEESLEVTAAVPAKPAVVGPKAKSGKLPSKKAAKKTGKAQQLEKDSTSKPEKKMDPNSQKHANFQRLKMRGKGPVNGKVGGRGRFGKKR
ncbi:dihydrolipoamide dehydrogenase [Venturia nashicola]|uniref:DNA replication regulator SLD2 n=1 Tax=Venturia nashicola TaxID=86259 RepID=A0A4Z1PJG6_9PEZI|nr:dihydrolipoamide dehydrogenase [Venturia nashicola]TLD35306.1 dihydrolipoamide dehydrogenase [Venturia nashicola]